MVRHRIQFVVAYQPCKYECGFLQCESGSETYPRPHAEWQIGLPDRVACFGAIESIRIEAVGCLPIFSVTLNQPRGNDYGVAGVDLFATQRAASTGLTGNEAHRREESQCLAEDVASELQGFQIRCLKRYRITDLLQKDHCRRANKREQRVVDLIRKSRLDKQTIV